MRQSSQRPPGPYELHYFGYALFRSSERDERELRGLELAAPGRSYVEALGTVYAAAAQELGLAAPTNLSIDGMEIDPTIAAVSVLQILIITGVLLIAQRFGRGATAMAVE